MSDGALKQADEFSPGDVCDGYRIVALIAAGGMGDVYEAVHPLTGDTVAFKCLKVRHRSKEDARARMKMEAVVLSELQHENLVQVFDAGVTESGMVWIAMERLHGQTLREVLHRVGKVPIVDALYYASEIADGVDAVHEVNVIHRDLKPENVFLTTRRVIKVLDLGTGKFTGYGLNSTDRMRVVGTTAYMSPEQIKGLRVDARADVYALGLMTYEMIAGHHPLAPNGGIAALPRAIEEVALMQLQTTPRALAEVMAECPKYVSAVVERAMAKNREGRHPDMTSFSRELRAARKRFIAENRIDEGIGESVMHDRGLREKFGAPPRQSSTPPPPPGREQAFGDKDTVIDLGRAHAADALCTDQASAPVFTSDGGVTPRASDHRTLPLAASTEQGLVGSPSGDITYRDVLLDDARNRSTNTNPVLFAPAELTPEPLSVPGLRPGGLSSWLRRPQLRRSAATLGLGALIGVPPAVVGVVWTAHRRAAVHLAAHPSSPAPDPGAAPLPMTAPADSAGAVDQADRAERADPVPGNVQAAGAPSEVPSSASSAWVSLMGGVEALPAAPSAASGASVERTHRSELKPARAPARPRIAKPRETPPVEPSAAPPLLVAPPVVVASASAPAPAASAPAPPATIILPPSGL